MRTRQKKKVKRTKRRRGGNKYFYAYNTNPTIFTNVSNKQQGGFIQNLLQRTGYGFQLSSDTSNGRYPKIYQDPDPLVQPISSNTKI